MVTILSEKQVPSEAEPRPIRTLLLLTLAFLVGLACWRVFRFTQPVLNYVFAGGVLLLPFLAVRQLPKLTRIPKILGYVVLSPVLLLSLLWMLSFVACGIPEWTLSGGKSCIADLGEVRQSGYSVHLLRDGCGGAVVSFMVVVEQRMPVLPGLYLFRTIDIFDIAYEGQITSAGSDEIRIQIPKGVPGSGWDKEIDSVYKLKRHIFF